MFQLLKKLKLYTKLGPETVCKYSHQNLSVVICRLQVPTKVFLQLEHHIELLFQYKEKLYLEMPVVTSNAHISTSLF